MSNTKASQCLFDGLLTNEARWKTYISMSGLVILARKARQPMPVLYVPSSNFSSFSVVNSFTSVSIKSVKLNYPIGKFLYSALTNGTQIHNSIDCLYQPYVCYQAYRYRNIIYPIRIGYRNNIYTALNYNTCYSHTKSPV